MIDESKLRPYTQEEIESLKAAGFDKPEDCSWGNWVGLKKLRHTHDLICHMAAQGATAREICENLGYTDARMSIILNSPKVKARIKELQDQFWGGNAEKKFKNLLGDAITTIEEVMTNVQEKGATRIAAAGMILDRAIGKPLQQVEVRGSLLAEVMGKLDALPARDVTPVLDSGKAHLDNFVDSFVEMSTVGERKKENE